MQVPISITAALRTIVISIKRATPALGPAASFASGSPIEPIIRRWAKTRPCIPSGTFACQIAPLPAIAPCKKKVLRKAAAIPAGRLHPRPSIPDGLSIRGLPKQMRSLSRFPFAPPRLSGRHCARGGLGRSLPLDVTWTSQLKERR